MSRGWKVNYNVNQITATIGVPGKTIALASTQRAAAILQYNIGANDQAVFGSNQKTYNLSWIIMEYALAT